MVFTWNRGGKFVKLVLPPTRKEPTLKRYNLPLIKNVGGVEVADIRFRKQC